MLKYFRPRVRTRHPSHKVLRPQNKNLPLFPFKSVIRLGSTTDIKDTVTNGGKRIELNTVKGIKNSSNKLLMKEAFTENNVKTADWWKISKIDDNIECFPQHNNDEGEYYTVELQDIPYPIISKSLNGSRGRGNKKHDNPESLKEFIENTRNLDNYIFEKYYNYVREYRLHVNSEGCFYACRKMLKRDTPNEERWFRNDKHCVWVTEYVLEKDEENIITGYNREEENPLFDKPVNWEEIIQECIKAVKSVGLDFGAIDLRIQSATTKTGEKRENPEFIIVEINSAPSFGNPDDPDADTFVKQIYIEEIPNMLNRKFKENE